MEGELQNREAAKQQAAAHEPRSGVMLCKRVADPLESACHMNEAEACAQLAHTLVLSRSLALGGLVILLAAPLAVWLRRRRPVES